MKENGNSWLGRMAAFLVRLREAYLNRLLRHPLWVLAAMALLVGGLGLFSPRLVLDVSPDALLLDGDEALQSIRISREHYGSQELLTIAYRPEDSDLMSDHSLVRLQSLVDTVGELPDVERVFSILNAPLLYSPKISLGDLSPSALERTLLKPGVDREQARREFLNSPLYRNLLLSEDGDVAAVHVYLQHDQHYSKLEERKLHWGLLRHERALNAEERRESRRAQKEFRAYSRELIARRSQLVRDMRARLAPFQDKATVRVAGISLIAADVSEYVQRDLIMFGLGVLAFIVLLLTLIFRRPRWVLLPLVMGGMCTLGVLGFLGLVGWPLTVISSNCIAILLILNLAMGVHLIVRYRELAAQYPDFSQAQLVRRTLEDMLRPCFYTVLTSLAAFLSLGFSDLHPVIDFGLTVSAGLLLTLLLNFSVLPAILVLLPREKNLPATGRSLTFGIARLVEKYRRTILWSGVALALASAAGIFRLDVENRFVDYFHRSTDIYQGMEMVDRELSGSVPLEIFIDHEQPAATPQDDFGDDFGNDFGEDPAATAPASNPWLTIANLDRIEQAHDFLEQLPVTGKVLSLGTVYKVLRDLGGPLDDVQLAFVYDALPETLRHTVLDPLLYNSQTRIVVLVKDTDHSLRRAEFLRRVRDYLHQEVGFSEQQTMLSGVLVLYNNVLQSLFHSQAITISVVVGMIFLMFLVLFRSPLLALLALAPNVLAALLVLGIMGWIRLPLDFMTITIAAITVGMGVDHAIHYIYRFRREFDRDRAYLPTMYRCHGSIGRAVFYTSATIIFGFAILGLSNFNPTVYFGLFISCAMCAVLLGSLLLLPALLISAKAMGAASPPDRQGDDASPRSGAAEGRLEN